MAYPSSPDTSTSPTRSGVALSDTWVLRTRCVRVKSALASIRSRALSVSRQRRLVDEVFSFRMKPTRAGFSLPVRHACPGIPSSQEAREVSARPRRTKHAAPVTKSDCVALFWKQTSLAESGQSKAFLVLHDGTWEEKTRVPISIGRRFFRVMGEDQPLPVADEVRAIVPSVSVSCDRILASLSLSHSTQGVGVGAGAWFRK